MVDFRQIPTRDTRPLWRQLGAPPDDQRYLRITEALRTQSEPSESNPVITRPETGARHKTMTDKAQTEPNMAEQQLREDGVHVQQHGIIEIEDEILDHFGFGPDDVVTVTIDTGSGTSTFNRTLDSRGRFTIPARIRRNLGIEQGDSVDVEVR